MRRAGWIVAAAGASLTAGSAFAGEPAAAVFVPGGVPLDIPFVSVDPRVDGADSFPGEWTDALVVPDAFADPVTGATPAGFFYLENKTSWTATSKTASITAYPGPTLFIAHDIFGAATGTFTEFRSNDAGDWNHVRVHASNGAVVDCWCFGGFSTNAPPHVPPVDLNEPDDGKWLPDAVGLGASALIPEGPVGDLIDDRGFIVRINGDPATDKHWFPGDPQPGDPAWDWNEYYGCFARAGFNKSFQDNLTDPDPSHAFDHEVYEWCFHECTAPIPPPLQPPIPPPWLPPPLQCTQWKAVLVDPPKRWVIYVAPNWFIHFGFPPVPAAPWPALAGLGLLLAAGGWWAFRAGRPARVSAPLVAALLATPFLGACGGGGGRNKQPPIIQIPVPVLRGAWTQNAYSDFLVATGQNPPFTFAVTTGSLPPGLTLNAATGEVSGTPTATGMYEFGFQVTDALLNAESTTSALYVGDWANPMIPIELVSLSLTSVSPIVVTQPGVEGIGSIRIRGGNPLAPVTFQCLTPPPLGSQLQFTPGGVARFTPAISQPPGQVPFLIQAQNGGPPFDAQFQIVFDVQP
jgi:hypothetical protein